LRLPARADAGSTPVSQPRPPRTTKRRSLSRDSLGSISREAVDSIFIGCHQAANLEPRHPEEAEGSVRQSSQLDQLRLPLVLTVEEAADRLGVGRTLMYSLVNSGAIESVRIGRLRRVPADALVTFLDELRRGIGPGAG
jgi:excisionase family DNA binding protein